MYEYIIYILYYILTVTTWWIFLCYLRVIFLGPPWNVKHIPACRETRSGYTNTKRQFHCSAAVFDSSNSSVFIRTGIPTNNVAIPGTDIGFFSSPKLPARPRCPPTLLFWLFPVDKAVGTWNWSCIFIFVLGWKWEEIWLDTLMWRHGVHRIALPSRPFLRVKSITVRPSVCPHGTT